jgi:hypothetical protein
VSTDHGFLYPLRIRHAVDTACSEPSRWVQFVPFDQHKRLGTDFASASHAEGRWFDPSRDHICCRRQDMVFSPVKQGRCYLGRWFSAHGQFNLEDVVNNPPNQNYITVRQFLSDEIYRKNVRREVSCGSHDFFSFFEWPLGVGALATVRSWGDAVQLS